jgi:hypothetical protein
VGAIRARVVPPARSDPAVFAVSVAAAEKCFDGNEYFTFSFQELSFFVFLTQDSMVSWTSIIVWTVSAVLAAGIGWSRYEKKKTRDKYLAELAAMDGDHREKLLLRLNPTLQTEVRQQLMLRYGLS